MGARGILSLPPAIDWAMRILASSRPGLSTDLRPTLARTTAPLIARPDDLAAWRLSTLTAGGHPFEITLTTGDDAVRFTLEVAPPASPRAGRLSEVATVMADVGCPTTPGILGQFTSFQAAESLAFGAWIGLRNRAGGAEAKVYAEVPAAAQQRAIGWFETRLGTRLGLPDRPKVLRMFGHGPADDTLEAYFSVHGLKPWELASLMHPVGLHGRAKDVLGCFETVLRRHLHQAFPTPVLGCSYSVAADRPATFSLYGFTEHLFGADGRTRMRVLAALERLGLSMPGYAELSRPMMDEASRSHGHGLFGVAVCGTAPPVLHLGVVPQAGAGDA